MMTNRLRALVAAIICVPAILLFAPAGWAEQSDASDAEATDNAAVYTEVTGTEVRGQPVAGEAFTEAGESGAALDDMVVEAENQVLRDIDKPTFELQMSAAVIDSFLTPVDEEALAISPVSGLQPHLNNLERLASDQAPHFWLSQMSTPPVVTFYPEDPEGHNPKSWSLTITDFRGATFKRFDGRGRPPTELPWDGRNDRDEILDVGYPYSYVFSITDRGTNTYNYAGVSFRLSALDYRLDGDRHLEFAGDDLFRRGEARLTDVGKDWLTRACDEVRRHPYSPIQLQLVAESQALASERAEIVATFLSDNMILPREQIETEATQQPDLRAEMDGSVTIVIEHAN